jgi:uncharacterized membrane protein
VAVGTSGGVTLLGTLGGGAGAVIIAMLTRAAHAPAPVTWITTAGVAGMLVDSALGASVQARFACAVCGQTVETRRHCASPAVHVRGLRWMTNDTVNVLGTGAGAAIAALAAG